MPQVSSPRPMLLKLAVAAGAGAGLLALGIQQVPANLLVSSQVAQLLSGADSRSAAETGYLRKTATRDGLDVDQASRQAGLWFSHSTQTLPLGLSTDVKPGDRITIGADAGPASVLEVTAVAEMAAPLPAALRGEGGAQPMRLLLVTCREIDATGLQPSGVERVVRFVIESKPLPITTPLIKGHERGA